MSEVLHIPVMLDEVLQSLEPKDGGVYLDGTFGAGGYSKAVLDSCDCTVIAIDRDQSALDAGKKLKDVYGDRLVLVHGCFSESLDLVQERGYEFIDGVVVDIGVSSMQLDQSERGFSFRSDGPLDMRMDQGSDVSAAQVVNELSEQELADIIYKFGEERMSRRVARKIVEARVEGLITTTGQLAEIVRSAVPFSPKDKNDPATRTFQALRIFVNDELLELERALGAFELLLSPGGHLVVVSFHSLEDKIVKSFLRQRAGLEAQSSRHLPDDPDQRAPVTFTLPSKKAIFPSEEEMAVNPRARSARLRSAIRTEISPYSKSSIQIAGGGSG